MITVMIMNQNTNNVGGRRFSRGGRNIVYPPNEDICSCSLPNWSQRIEDLTLCLLKRLSLEARAKSDRHLGFQLLSVLLTINIGNAEQLTEREMGTFLNESKSPCSFDGM